MLCYSLVIYTVEPEKAPHFVGTLRRGGLWHALSTQMPGHLGTSVLESDTDRFEFLVIDFWISRQSFGAAQTNPATVFLATFLDRLAQSSIRLGMFVLETEQLPLEESSGLDVQSFDQVRVH